MSHVEAASLFDYWAAELRADEEAALEEHVFACDDCARRLQTTGALVAALPRVIARRGGVNLFLTRGLAEQLERSGIVLNHYPVKLGDTVHCSVRRDDDMLVTWIGGDFRGHDRLRMEFLVDGKPYETCDDVPVDDSTGQIIYTIRADIARRMPDNVLLVRLFAGDELLGETTFRHSAVRP